MALSRIPLAAILTLGTLALGSCGPELTMPSSTDMSGIWVSPGPAAGMTNMSVTLIQATDGSLTGTYTATGTKPLQFCPRTGICTISSTVSGLNTALQVTFYMKDAGTFTGQLIGPGKIHGAMSRISTTQAVEFTRQ